MLTRDSFVLLQLGLATVAILLGSFPIFVRCVLCDGGVHASTSHSFQLIFIGIVHRVVAVRS
jgi:hypothetical protein